jgi:hypothetical protein
LREWTELEMPHHHREFTRECLAIDVAGSIRSERVIQVLVTCPGFSDQS